MKSNLMLLITCLVISTGCLAAGYILSGHWLIFLVFPLMAIAWLLTYKRSMYLSASILLSGYVILASVGIIAELSSALMIIACITALVSWDLLQVNQSVSGFPLGKKNGLLEKHHLNSLALAASASLVLSLISANLTLQFPFVAIVFLILIAMGCLIYGMQFVVKKDR